MEIAEIEEDPTWSRRGERAGVMPLSFSLLWQIPAYPLRLNSTFPSRFSKFISLSIVLPQPLVLCEGQRKRSANVCAAEIQAPSYPGWHL